MALRKPSDFFNKKNEDINIPVVESDNSLREELNKVESLSEQLNQLQQELTQKVVKNDLESLVLSQINMMRENFDELQNEFKLSNKNDLSKFKEIISEITEIVNNLVEEEIPKYKKQITSHEVRLSNQFEDFKGEVEERVQHFYQVLNEFNDVVQVIDNVSNIEKYLQEHHQELIELREEVFGEIENLPFGNLHENLQRLEKKIDYIRDTYSSIDPESVAKEIIQEGLLNEPPETKNEDPLTPLNQNFVTIDQLQEHYRLFINRIQQQLSTLGGGGEYRLKYLDDIVGIATNASAYDGKFLKYNHNIGKFEFVTVSGGGTQNLNTTLGYGNTSSLGMSVGVVTTPSINFTSGAVLDDIYNDGGFGLKSAANQYATIASNNLQQFVVVDDSRILIGAAYTGDNNYKYWNFDKNGNITFPDNTIQSTAFVGYANIAGISTYASAAGIATYASTAGVSTYATSSGISTYASTAGVSTSAGTATTATNLANAANITTGTINKDRISTTNSLTVLGDLYVSNNISFGGTSTQLNAQQLQIVDADIVLGIGTTFSSTDNTANHGGIAIASTEGTPLVSLNIVPGETNPTTYKKIMWFKGSTIGAGLTDAWLFNYGVGIGSTNVPNGVRLAVGNVQVTQNDLSVIRNINSSGVVTASSFVPSSGYIKAPDGTNSLYIYSGSGNVAFQGTIGASQINSASGYKALDFGATVTPSVNITNSLNVSGVSSASETRINSVAEKTTVGSGNTISIVYNTGGGNIAICTNPTGDITLNVTGIPTDSTFNNYSLTFSVIVSNTGTARSCTALTLNGVSASIKWFGGSLAAAISGVTTTTGYDIYNFTGINTVGSASTTANYIVLGSVNGGYR